MSEKPLNPAHWSAMFLSGTLLNVATVLLGTTIGLVAGRRLPARLGEGLTTGLGLFVAVIAVTMAGSIFTDPAAQPGDELAVLGGLLAGVAVGELLGLQDRLESLGAWFQSRLSRGERPSRVAEAFVTASLVFCVGPLTVLGSWRTACAATRRCCRPRRSSTASQASPLRPRWVRVSISPP